MRQRVFQRLFVAAVTFFMGGCGTFANTLWLADFEGGKRPYGGVRADWEMAHEAIDRFPEPSGANLCLCTAVLCGIDLPFSAIGDSLTLPLTIPYTTWWADRSHPLQTLGR